jgi:ribulose-5-phosphate 4-epimerase/fuculose-1-phosphate aldolase
VPVYPRSILVASPEIGQAMLKTMEDRDICLLAGHGNVITGRTVEEATTRAIQIENLAKLCWTVATAGLKAPDILPEDIEEIRNPKQPAAIVRRDAGGEDWLWHYYLKMWQDGTPLHAEHGIWQS